MVRAKALGEAVLVPMGRRASGKVRAWRDFLVPLSPALRASRLLGLVSASRLWPSVLPVGARLAAQPVRPAARSGRPAPSRRAGSSGRQGGRHIRLAAPSAGGPNEFRYLGQTICIYPLAADREPRGFWRDSEVGSWLALAAARAQPSRQGTGTCVEWPQRASSSGGGDRRDATRRSGSAADWRDEQERAGESGYIVGPWRPRLAGWAASVSRLARSRPAGYIRRATLSSCKSHQHDQQPSQINSFKQAA